MKTTYKVEGMMCNGCRSTVENKLNEIPGIKASVNLDTNTATIDSAGDISLKTLQDQLSGTHYKLAEVQDTVNQEQNPKVSPNLVGEKFQCPMHCEHDKMYDQAGGCPICGMDLEKITIGKKKM